MELITVVNAEYQQDFKLFLKFNDGSSGIVDLNKYLDGEIFEPLKNTDYFKKFSLDTWTIGWDNGADFAPEFLYELAKKDDNTQH
jgi:hypothetical protein